MSSPSLAPDDERESEDLLTFSINSAAFVFDLDHPAEGRSEAAVVAIDRRSGKFVNASQLLPGTVSYPVQCLLGCVKLLAGPYLIVATHSKLVAKFPNYRVYEITKVALEPVSRRVLDGSLKKTEAQYIELLTDLLEDGSFYYSPDIDLSSSTQQRVSGKSVSETESDIFSWNKAMRARLTSLVSVKNPQLAQLGELVLSRAHPVIRGFVGLVDALVVHGNQSATLAIISRLGNERPGRRYTMRGAAKDGSVTNHVETEQILFSSLAGGGYTVASHVQLRGSIPLLWSQHANLRWNPPIVIKSNDETQSRTLHNHFKSVLDRYEAVTCVSLVKTSGGEAPLGSAYSTTVAKEGDEDVVFVPFDLHKEVGLSKFENFSKLFANTDSQLAKYGFCSLSGKDVVKKQCGVMRTNCKDNLDRTNVVQGRFAVQVFWDQVSAVLSGFTPSSVPPTERSHIERQVGILWADNGDRCSVMYAGTPAIRGDFTRTGKSTFRGLINDGLNSLNRFYINNFEDGRHQDALDVLLQKRPLPDSYALDLKAHPMKKEGGIKKALTSLCVFVMNLIRPRAKNPLLLHSLLWMLSVFALWFLFRLNPERILNIPILKYNQVKGNKKEE